MAYRANVTDKQQNEIEGKGNQGAIRVPGIDGNMKVFKSYDLQRETSTVGESDAKKMADGISVGSHNDKPHRFETPGKA